MKNAKHHTKSQNNKSIPGKSQGYWLYGIHSVEAALHNSERTIYRIIATEATAKTLLPYCNNRNITPVIASPSEIVALLPTGAVHQGIAAEVKFLPATSLEEYLFQTRDAKKPLLVLDQVTDPHNVGAMLRSAAAFGAGAVITTKDNAPTESATMAKASSGGIEIVPFIHVTNLVQALKALKTAGYWCIGLDGEAKQTLKQTKLGNDTAFILGGEGQGLRRLTLEHCDMIVKLPISSQMESLNVSNAAAIALYELVCRN